MSQIKEIKAKKMFGGPGSWVWLAEAVVDDGEKHVYVTVQYYDGEEYTVTDKSMYDALTADDVDFVDTFIEEYDSWREAGKSEYAKVFKTLRDVIDRMD